MILREKQIKKGEILWKAGDSASYALIIKDGSMRFFGCQEADLGLTFTVKNFSL